MRIENVLSVCATAVIVAMFGASAASGIHQDRETTRQMEICVTSGGDWLPSGPGRHICETTGATQTWGE